MKHKLNLDYGGIQGAYSTISAGISAFASVFLLANHFTNTEIGWIVAIGNLIAVFCQPLIAIYADQHPQIPITRLIFSIAIIDGLLIGGLFFLSGRSLTLAIFYILALGVWALFQPLVNSLSFHLAHMGIYINFGATRAVGSFGYMVVTAFLGSLIEKWGINAIPGASEICIIWLIAMVVLFAMHFKQAKIQAKPVSEDLEEKIEEDIISMRSFIKRHKNFLLVTVGIACVFYGFNILGSFTYQIIKPFGGTSADMGRMLALSALTELPVMPSSDYLLGKFKTTTLLKISMVGFIGKVFFFLIASKVWVAYLASFMQFCGYALFYPVMVAFINENMTSGEAIKGQSLFTMMMTLAGIIGTFTGGFLIDSIGIKPMLVLCLVTTIIGAAIVAIFADRVSKQN